MGLSLGIVGLPNVGKSTLFNALTKRRVPAENYPFNTIDPNVGVIMVPDHRLDRLAEMSNSERKIPAAVEFVDIAGLVKGASRGEGLGNQFLSHIRAVDAIVEVVRIFDDDDVHHIYGHVDPRHDIEIIDMELALADLQVVERRLERLERDVKNGDSQAVTEWNALRKIVAILQSGKPLRAVTLDEHEKAASRSLHLLTLKPVLYVLNRKSGAVNVDAENGERWRELTSFFRTSGDPVIFFDAGVEQDLSDIGDDNERDQFRRELGVLENGVNALIRAGYSLLGLISFFTTGKKESRAWTVRRGSTAPEAGAAIHSDFCNKFIRADVIRWDTLIECGSWAKAREKGFVRTEGREYVVEDGDVIEFKV